MIHIVRFHFAHNKIMGTRYLLVIVFEFRGQRDTITIDIIIIPNTHGLSIDWLTKYKKGDVCLYIGGTRNWLKQVRKIYTQPSYSNSCTCQNGYTLIAICVKHCMHVG